MSTRQIYLLTLRTMPSTSAFRITERISAAVGLSNMGGALVLMPAPPRLCHTSIAFWLALRAADIDAAVAAAAAATLLVGTDISLCTRFLPPSAMPAEPQYAVSQAQSFFFKRLLVDSLGIYERNPKSGPLCGFLAKIRAPVAGFHGCKTAAPMRIFTRNPKTGPPSGFLA